MNKVIKIKIKTMELFNERKAIELYWALWACPR